MCPPLINSNSFYPDINQSDVEDSFQLASDWIKSARKNVNKSKAVTLLGPFKDLLLAPLQQRAQK